MILPPCANRGCSQRSSKQCTRCKFMMYCCRDCQVSHWKIHQKLCNILNDCPEKRFVYVRAQEFYDMGYHLFNEERYEEALVAYRKALVIFRETFGEKYELTVNCHQENGKTLRAKDELEEALVELRKALAIQKETLGENDKDTANTYEDIGTILLLQERYDDALIGIGKALAIRLRVLGENHVNVGTSYFHIAVVLEKKGQYDEALASIRKANAINKRELGEGHIDSKDYSQFILRLSCKVAKEHE